mmetsp:Transcript_16492/g.31061  ORF Transcript_16492/g.31061 Transcript_16492/m.31061 type:complete len:97 (+) Transcript_16492:448-738(+)
MSRAVIVLNDGVDEFGRLTLMGTLSIRRSPCIINDCPVPDMSLVDTAPVFVINITGTKLLDYRTTSIIDSSSSSVPGSFTALWTTIMGLLIGTILL